MWIAAVATPKKQIKMKPFAGRPMTREQVNTQV